MLSALLFPIVDTSLNKHKKSRKKIGKIPSQKKDFQRENLTNRDNFCRQCYLKHHCSRTSKLMSLSLLIGPAETNINFAKFRLRRKIFEKPHKLGQLLQAMLLEAPPLKKGRRSPISVS